MYKSISARMCLRKIVISVPGTFFKVTPHQSNHLYHQKRCIELGGRLAVIKNKGDDEKFRSTIQTFALNKHIYSMGLYTPQEHVHLWLNGEPIKYK